MFFKLTLFMRSDLNNISNYPTSKDITYFWNLGSFLGMLLMFQSLSGFLLTFYYVSSSLEAFSSSDYIGREIHSGYILRVFHLNGASFFFLCLYMHIFRGIFYMCFNQTKTWLSGTMMYLLSMGIAFLGYVLPWGQMSFWGASVITNLLATIPITGQKIVLWVWGGFNVNGATLSIFFSLHYILPFILMVLMMSHLYFLHEKGSMTPTKNHSSFSKISFGEYFMIKDSLNLPPMLILYSTCLLGPWVLGDPENWIPANPMKSPVHIQPEWYFLFAYAILRSIPNKLGGVICLLASVLVLFLLPQKNTLNQTNNMIYKILVGFLIMFFFSLTWLGGCGVEDPFIIVGQIYSFLYFFFFLLLLII